MKDDRAAHISTARRRQIIEEFASLSPKGAVVICGGEGMLDPKPYYDISRTCLRTGLRCLSVINGTKVQTPATARRLLREGPAEITVSLNSHQEKSHDETRGVQGAYRIAVKTVRLLVRERARLKSNRRIYVMAIVSEKNYRELDPFYEFVLHDLKADKLKLNFIQPTFGLHGHAPDRYFERNVIKDEKELVRIIRACDRKYKLDLNPKWYVAVTSYHRSVRRNGDAILGWGASGGTDRPICNSCERNIMVDLYGVARLCFAPRFPGFHLEYPGDMRAFWEGTDMIRRMMRECRAYCGISHSVRRENATLKPGKPISKDRS